MELSRFFTLAEMTRSDTARKEGIPNEPGAAETENLRALCAAVLDPLREAIGQPIQVNSGYRGPKLNQRIGGASNSQHVEGKAADLQAAGMPVLELFKRIIRLGLPFDQLIYEAKSQTAKWVHVSHSAGGNHGQIMKANFGPGGKPPTYSTITAEQALAMMEPLSRAGGPAATMRYHEIADEPPPPGFVAPAAPRKAKKAKRKRALPTTTRRPAAKRVVAKRPAPKRKAAKKPKALRRRAGKTAKPRARR